MKEGDGTTDIFYGMFRYVETFVYMLKNHEITKMKREFTRVTAARQPCVEEAPKVEQGPGAVHDGPISIIERKSSSQVIDRLPRIKDPR